MFINSFDPYNGDQMCDYNNALSLSYIGIALSCDMIPNLIFLNIIGLLVFFVSHPIIYMRQLDFIHITIKLVSVICIDVFYIYIFIAFAYIVRIFNRVGS